MYDSKELAAHRSAVMKAIHKVLLSLGKSAVMRPSGKKPIGQDFEEDI